MLWRQIESLHASIRPLLFKIASHVLRDRADVEDVIQDTLIRLAELGEKVDYSDLRRVRALAGYIVKGKAVDLVRKKARLQFQPDVERPLEQQRLKAEDRAEYWLEKLNEDDRLLIKDRILDEISYREIAAARHISESTARKRVERALKRLKRLIEQEE